MSFLAGLGAASSGAAQGAQGGADLLQKYQAIQQGRMALSQAEKQVQAEAAVFAGLGGPQEGAAGIAGLAPPPGPAAGPMAQPMMPGQASVPNQPPPQGGPGTSPAASTLPPPVAGSPAPPPQGGGGSLPGGQPGGGIDPTDPQAAVKTVMSIAREIKSRNPDITPELLFMATSHIIDMSKGIAPQLRQGAQVVIQELKGAQQANLQGIKGDQKTGQISQQGDIRSGQIAQQGGLRMEQIGAQNAGALQRVHAQGEQAMARTQASITAANQRQQNGQWSKEKRDAYADRVRMVSAKLRTATSRISALTAAGVAPTDPRAVQAGKEVQDALGEMDRVDAAAKVTPAGGAPEASGAAPAPTPAGGGQPPAGFKQAPDGKYYAPDPKRPGKYLMWTP